MNLDRFLKYTDRNKNYFITSESDIKYLMWSSYIEWISILIKNKVINILANILIIDTVKNATENKYNVLDLWKKGVSKKIFDWIDELIVDPNNTNMADQDFLIKNWVKKLISVKELLKPLRSVKSYEEIVKLRKSQEINIKTFEFIQSLIKPWMTELEIAKLIKIKHLEFWSSWESFEPIVAFGKFSAEAHHVNDNKRKLTYDDQILIDMWCIFEWYCSDMTRVIFMEKCPQKQIELYESVRKIAYECLKYWKVWMKYKDLHNKAVELFGVHKKKFTHQLWHWVWIDIHEYPLWMSRIDDVIKEDEVITIEPWIYFPWKYWFRYEIMAVAKKTWFIEL